jgi:NitT/TauT family transport system permease protein
MSAPRGWERWALPLAVALPLLVCWHLAVRLSGSDIFPAPIDVARGIQELVTHGLLLKYVVASLFRVSVGFMLALAVGIPLGLLIGWFERLFAALNPLIQVLRPISPIAWIPVAILWFGVDDRAPIFLIFLASVFPIVTATTTAVRAIPAVYIRAARNFGVSGLDLFRRVVLPAALPQVITGVRLALGIAWLVVVAAEMIAGRDGLGFAVMDSRNGLRMDYLVANMTAIGLMGVALDRVLLRLTRIPSVRWGYEQ